MYPGHSLDWKYNLNILCPHILSIAQHVFLPQEKVKNLLEEIRKLKEESANKTVCKFHLQPKCHRCINNIL